MNSRTVSHGHELVPLTERIRYLAVFRLVAATLTVAAWLLLPSSTNVSVGQVVVATGVWLVVMSAITAVWRLSGRRMLWLFGVMVMIDAAAVVVFSYVLAGGDTPVRHLLLVHVVAVALLASFRTGLKLAMWDSLLLLTVFHLHELGWLGASTAPAVGDGEYRALLGTIVLIWVVAIATASFAAVNERELRRRRFDLEALRRFTLELEGSSAPAAIAERLARAVQDDFDLTRALVLGVDEGGAFVLHAQHDDGQTRLDPLLDGSNPAVLDAALTTNRPLLVTHLPADDRLLGRYFPGARNLVLMPLTADGDAVGVLIAEHALRSGSRMERRVISMLEQYAVHTALALRNAWLLERLELSATTDALTGIGNRRVFDHELARELARANRSDEPVTLLLLDVDHFKRLNDTLGHVAGDEVLHALATALAEETRLGDTLARYGGEEFAVLLPGVTEEQAFETAERFRAVAASLDLDTPVTVSVGAAVSSPQLPDPLALTTAADAALYAAKRSGRNRVCVHSDRPLELPDAT